MLTVILALIAALGSFLLLIHTTERYRPDMSFFIPTPNQFSLFITNFHSTNTILISDPIINDRAISCCSEPQTAYHTLAEHAFLSPSLPSQAL